MSIFWIVFFGAWGIAIIVVMIKAAMVGVALVLSPFYRVYRGIRHREETKERWQKRIEEDKRWKLVFWLWGIFALLCIIVVIIDIANK